MPKDSIFQQESSDMHSAQKDEESEVNRDIAEEELPNSSFPEQVSQPFMGKKHLFQT